tara:strand:- start:382 stop:582 length:201 start_codon:yes stop_codon:yes gene_type:complete
MGTRTEKITFCDECNEDFNFDDLSTFNKRLATKNLIINFNDEVSLSKKSICKVCIIAELECFINKL